MRRLPPALAASATPRILELLGDGPGRVLELGFAGIHARLLELAGWEVIVVEPDPARAEQARQRGARVVERPEKRFDAVIAPSGADLAGIDGTEIVLVDERGIASIVEMTTGARYDGIADWYDTEFQPAPLESETWETIRRLLGEGTGSLVDVGCGTGAYAAGLAELGWDVTGVDVSEDMLRRARAKGVRAIQADAASLPLENATFDAAISVFTNTDVDDLAAVLREIVRVLRPGTPLVYVAVHPCFVGPHSVYDPEGGIPQFHPGWYRHVGRHTEAPGIWRSSGVRIRVGATHLPLGLFLQTFLDAGLRLELIEEPETLEYPFGLALRWRR